MIKRVCFIFSFFILCFSLLACGSTSNPTQVDASNSDGKLSEESLSKIEESLSEIEESVLSFVSENNAVEKVVAIEQPDGISLSLWLDPSTDISAFGNAIYDTMTACDDIPEISMVSVYLDDNNGNSIVLFNTGIGKLGSIVDARSGKKVTRIYDTYEDLSEAFPMLIAYQQANEVLSEADLAIYNEVWDALDSEPDRPEEDIFEELGPSYGMTGSELKEFIVATMEKVYE